MGRGGVGQCGDGAGGLALRSRQAHRLHMCSLSGGVHLTPLTPVLRCPALYVIPQRRSTPTHLMCFTPRVPPLPSCVPPLPTSCVPPLPTSCVPPHASHPTRPTPAFMHPNLPLMRPTPTHLMCPTSCVPPHVSHPMRPTPAFMRPTPALIRPTPALMRSTPTHLMCPSHPSPPHTPTLLMAKPSRHPPAPALLLLPGLSLRPSPASMAAKSPLRSWPTTSCSTAWQSCAPSTWQSQSPSTPLHAGMAKAHTTPPRTSLPYTPPHPPPCFAGHTHCDRCGCAAPVV